MLEGGGLADIDKLGTLTIKPKMNQFVVFWSDSVPHEVLDIDSNRLSFQIFFSQKEE